MKNITVYLTTLALIGPFSCSIGQGIVNSGGATLKIDVGAILVVKGNVDNAPGSTVINNGELILSGNLVNQGAFQSGTSSTIQFDGNAESEMTSNGSLFENITLKKSSADVSLMDAATIEGNLFFDADDNHLKIGNHNLTLGSNGTISGFDNNKFIVTGGSGVVKKLDLDTLFFPVGFDENTYNLIGIKQNGTIDHISVRCMENVLSDGISGAVVTENVVDASWVIDEEVIGGSNVNVTAYWNASEELTGFHRSSSGISRFDAATGWTLTFAEHTPANGIGPFAQHKTGITEFSAFAVGDSTLLYDLLVEPRVFLAGAFVTTDMRDDLRGKGLIPIQEPYGNMAAFTHVADGGNEETSAAVLSATGSDAIVDWVFLELRSKTDTSTVLATRSALVQRDGDIVDASDGTGNVRFSGLANDDYFLAIRHRNHLGVSAKNVRSLNGLVTTAVDFTDIGFATYGNHAQRNMGTTMALWSGNSDSNNRIVYLASGSDINPISADVLLDPPNAGIFSSLHIVNDVYRTADTDMDGRVVYLASGSDINPISASVFLHPDNAGVFSPLHIIHEQLK